MLRILLHSLAFRRCVAAVSCEASPPGFPHSECVQESGTPEELKVPDSTFSQYFGVVAYQTDAAYAASMLSLLASTRAVHGVRAMNLIKFAVEGRDAGGAAVALLDGPIELVAYT